MRPFAYSRAENVESAVGLISRTEGAKFLGGGTNLIDLMRESVEQPARLVDVTRLPLAEIEETADGGVRVGALVRNSRLAADATIRERYPALSEAILAGASGQIRNMATTGGNLLQRTRCYYFYDGEARCNKREPGSGCDALDGFNRIHAVLGTSDSCIATHPSDMCVALAAFDATIHVHGPNGERRVPIADLHRLPEDRPEVDTTLEADELITAVELPALPIARHSTYRKVRDRASYAFALVSVAAALEIEDGVVTGARVALGGVAHKPWRARAAEVALAGAPATTETFKAAAAEELRAARGYRYNSFKIELAQRTIVSVLQGLVARGGAR